jgi:hypothetical protein
MAKTQDSKQALEKYLTKNFNGLVNHVSVEPGSHPWEKQSVFILEAHFYRKLTDAEREILPTECQGTQVQGSSPDLENGPGWKRVFGGTGGLKI